MFSKHSQTSGQEILFSLDSPKVRLLIEEIEKPCLLVNITSGRILCANNLLVNLTHHSINSIVGNDSTALFDNLLLNETVDGEIKSINLIGKNGSSSPVKIEILSFDPKREIALIKILDDNFSKGKEDFREKFIQMSLKILSNYFYTRKTEFLPGLAVEIKELFAAKSCRIYEKLPEDDYFSLITPASEYYPKEIPRVEIERIAGHEHWAIGKRILTSLHRAARKSNAKQLISIRTKTSGNIEYLVSFDFSDGDIQKELFEKVNLLQDWLKIILDIVLGSIKIQNQLSMMAQRNVQLEFIQENLWTGTLITDEDENILDFNSAFCDLFQFSPIDLLGKPIKNLFPDISREFFSESSEKEDIRYFQNKSGRLMPLFFHTKTLISNSNKLNISFFRDASEYIFLTDGKQELEKKAILGETIADFAHEVRNPINNIATGIQLIDQSIEEGDPNKETLARTLEDCIRINYLMESILSYSRQEKNNFTIGNLKNLINRIVFQQKAKIENSGHKIFFESEVEYPKVKMDQKAIEQVLINLINNSLEAFSSPEGIISLKLESQDGKNGENGDNGNYVITVADTGSGIPQEIEKKLFDPFTTGKSKGTGLGLAISKRIIENHDGTIEAFTIPGGTFFSITLPKSFEGAPN